MKIIYRRIIHWSLFVLIILYLVSGLGITYYRTVELLTFGLMSKALSLIIHEWLLWPFLALFTAHMYLTVNWAKLFKRKKK